MTKNKVDLALKVLIGVLLAALIAIVGRTMYEHVVQAGDTAPEFAVVTDRGAHISPSDFGGDLLLLHFWASWCAPCVEEVPSFNKLQSELSGSGTVLLGVSVDTNEPAYKRFVDQNHVLFQTMRDPSADISGTYGTFKFPETYVIDRDRKVIQKIIGPRQWGSLKAGDAAPGFSVPMDAAGSVLSSSAFAGKTLVLHFFTSWCKPCETEMASLNALQQQTTDSGVVVLGISGDADQNAYSDFLARNHVVFQTVRDSESLVSPSYGTFRYPETYIITRTGTIARKLSGPQDWNGDLVNFVKSL